MLPQQIIHLAFKHIAPNRVVAVKGNRVILGVFIVQEDILPTLNGYNHYGKERSGLRIIIRGIVVPDILRLTDLGQGKAVR